MRQGWLGGQRAMGILWRIGHREWNIAGGRDGRDGWGEEYEEVSGAPSEPAIAIAIGWEGRN